MQWGNDLGQQSFTSLRNIYFPIAFSVIFAVSGGRGHAHDDSYENGPIDLFPTYFTYRGVSSSTSTVNSVSWMAIGVS